jgi:hypothetical protein
VTGLGGKYCAVFSLNLGYALNLLGLLKCEEFRLLRYGCSHLLTLVPRLRVFLPWNGRLYVPPKRQFTQNIHGPHPRRRCSS